MAKKKSAKKGKGSTPYTRLQKAKKAVCKGTGTKASAKKAAAAYVKAAVKKSKAKGKAATKVRKAAKAKANRVLHSACSTSAFIAGKKRSTRKRTGGRKRK